MPGTVPAASVHADVVGGRETSPAADAAGQIECGERPARVGPGDAAAQERQRIGADREREERVRVRSDGRGEHPQVGGRRVGRRGDRPGLPRDAGRRVDDLQPEAGQDESVARDGRGCGRAVQGERVVDAVGGVAQDRVQTGLLRTVGGDEEDRAAVFDRAQAGDRHGGRGVARGRGGRRHHGEGGGARDPEHGMQAVASLARLCSLRTEDRYRRGGIVQQRRGSRGASRRPGARSASRRAVARRCRRIPSPPAAAATTGCRSRRPWPRRRRSAGAESRRRAGGSPTDWSPAWVCPSPDPGRSPRPCRRCWWPPR